MWSSYVISWKNTSNYPTSTTTSAALLYNHFSQAAHVEDTDLAALPHFKFSVLVFDYSFYISLWTVKYMQSLLTE